MTKARTLADNYAADINQVTADAPLTGGGTSGTVTVGIQAGTTAQSGAVQLTDSTASTSTTTAATPNSVKSAYDLANTANTAASSAQTTANAAIAKSTIDAKGDLLVGSANDTVSRLAVASTAGYVLTVDSAEATGLKWGAPPGGGKVLQVVSGTTTSNVSTTNTSGTDSGLSASITPSSTSSKILVLSSQLIQISRVSSNGKTGVVKLNRGTTTLTTWNTDAVDLAGINVAANSSQQIDLCTWVSFSYLDSPNTTSSTTYKTQILNTVSSGTATIQAQKENFMGSIVLLEIGA